MTGLLPMVPLVERAFGVNQNVGDILHVADLPLPAPDLEQWVVSRRLRVGRVEQQDAAVPRAKAGRELPVFPLDVVNDGRTRPSQQRGNDKADTFAGPGGCETQHVLWSIMTKVVAVELTQHYAIGTEKSGLFHLLDAGPARRAIGLD